MFPEGRIFEFMIVGAIALIVVGPKDLPILMRKVGRFVAHMRGMAAEFRASFDEMARQSELDELRKEVEAMRAGHSLPAAVGLGDGSPGQQVFDDIHATLRADPSPPIHAPEPAEAPAPAVSADHAVENPPHPVTSFPEAPAPAPAQAAS